MKRLTSLTAILTLFTTSSVLAELTPKSHIGPAGIDFQSQVGAHYGYDDNVTYQVDSDDAIQSNYWAVTPTLQMIGQRDEDKYFLMYEGEYRRFEQAEENDYDRHFMMFEGEWRYGLKHGLKWNIAKTYSQDRRGRELTEGFTQSQFEQYGLADAGLKASLFDTQLRYIYGAPEGRGHLNVMLETKGLKFHDTGSIRDANEDFYVYVQQQEWREDSGLVELFDQYSTDTRFRYSLITNRRRYQVDDVRDSNEYYLLFGVKTIRSGKSTLEMDLSLLYKEFQNNPNAEDFLGFNWDIDYQWKPVNYSIFDLYTVRTVKDPTEEGGYVLENTYGASWQHFWWVDRFSTKLAYEFKTDDFHMPSERFDKTHTAKFSLVYDWRPSVSLELTYQWNQMKSNNDTDEFYIGPTDSITVLRQLGYEQSTIDLQLRVQI